MAADNPRIDELRGRLDKDPASIAFAQLAEEYRRAGDHPEAVRVCRAGLAQHPTYVSARVTLGRALMELDKLDEAQAEFEHVLLTAPDNLVALRSMAELYQRRGETPPEPAAGAPLLLEDLPPLPELTLPPLPDVPPLAASEVPPAVPPLDFGSPSVDEALPMPDIALQPDEAEAAAIDVPLDLDAAVAAFNEAFGVPRTGAPPDGDAQPVDVRPTDVEPADVHPGDRPAADLQADEVRAVDPVLEQLEAWLAAIRADRDDRAQQPRRSRGVDGGSL